MNIFHSTILACLREISNVYENIDTRVRRKKDDEWGISETDIQNEFQKFCLFDIYINKLKLTLFLFVDNNFMIKSVISINILIKQLRRVCVYFLVFVSYSSCCHSIVVHQYIKHGYYILSFFSNVKKVFFSNFIQYVLFNKV